jgi:dienelactone hydrolase
MIGDVILPDTPSEAWPGVREVLRQRILATFGTPGMPVPAGRTTYEIAGQYEQNGLTHVRVRYHVIGDEWNEAVALLPPTGSALPAPAVLAIHGTNGARGKMDCLEPREGNVEPYAFELAERGFVTFAADQLTFGATIAAQSAEGVAADFYRRHPPWTLDGRWVFEQARMLDVMQQLTQWVKPTELGLIGISLGGRTVIHLAMADERVKATVCASGISPNSTNVYRRITANAYRNPILAQRILDGAGRMPWDYHEVIALCAPRALFLIEPFNDEYNPDIEATLRCFSRASDVYRLLNHPERLALLVHGDGHGTQRSVRDIAYDWLGRQLVR